ncbi:MFS transporter [Streptomyces triculaminicus]|uniref:MFS transporter n=1 Tax=Streptomyces triculaminicus TaxID=2816232 RepID=UPI0037D88504
MTPAVFTGRWAARHTRGPGDGAPLMRTGLLCLAAGLLTGGLGRDGPTPLWLVGISCSLVGCGLGLANGAAMATVTRDRPLHTASRATATATTFAMLGGAAGPALAGALTTSLPHLPLLVTALTTAVASLALTRTARPRTAAEEPPGPQAWGLRRCTLPCRRPARETGLEHDVPRRAGHSTDRPRSGPRGRTAVPATVPHLLAAAVRWDRPVTRRNVTTTGGTSTSTRPARFGAGSGNTGGSGSAARQSRDLPQGE